MQDSSEWAMNNRQRYSISTAAYFHNPFQDSPSAAGQSSDLKHATTKEHNTDFYHKRPSLALSTSKDALKIPALEKNKTSHNSRRRGWRVAWQWSRMHKGLAGRNNAIRFESSRSFHGYPQKKTSSSNCSRSRLLSSQENSREETDPMSLHDDICRSGFNHVYFSRNSSQCIDKEQKIPRTSDRWSSMSLSHKYQPKSFEDIVGHEINIKVISNAIRRNKVAQLYLFHGPSGTGKTSTALVFAMALHCESTSVDKPCWTCRGCSKSLYMIELCSGSRTTGFQRIITLIQCTSFAQALPGFKVFIIEESDSLTAEAWNELLRILDNTYCATMVFLLIAGDANLIPESISSRCQKFCFPRLEKMDVTSKLARIVAKEGIRIEEEALKLIVDKAEGSLKEAEHILDQITLLGPRITSSMVQQLVGLIPKNKLIDLLTAALSGDIEKTIITARKLITTGIEAESIRFQLASLITDVLTGAAITIPNPLAVAGSPKEELQETQSQLGKLQQIIKNCILKISRQPIFWENFAEHYESESLCYALKILVEAEKQQRSSFDHVTWVYGALLQIASRDTSGRISSGSSSPRRISLPSGDTIISQRKSLSGHQSTREMYMQQNTDIRYLNTTDRITEKTMRCKGKEIEREFNFACLRDMHEIWLNILDRIYSKDMKEFLSNHAKLASLTVSIGNILPPAR